jgi:predicted DNA-binding transcriptional regulator YafY
MPYRELTMIDIKEVLRRWSARQSLHQIARETGVDRKTVRRYVRAAHSCSLPQGRELTEGEIHEVAQRVQSRPLPEASAEQPPAACRPLSSGPGGGTSACCPCVSVDAAVPEPPADAASEVASTDR